MIESDGVWGDYPNGDQLLWRRAPVSAIYACAYVYVCGFCRAKMWTASLSCREGVCVVGAGTWRLDQKTTGRTRSQKREERKPWRIFDAVSRYVGSCGVGVYVIYSLLFPPA